MLEALEAAGRRAEDLLLSALLLAMISIAAWQIFGRNVLDSSLANGDELLRILVLWLTLAGAVAASRADRHIAISLLDRFLEGWQLNLARAITHGFTAVICGLLCWFSAQFVGTTREFDDRLLGDIPAWWLQAPLVVGFGLMTWRHALHTLMWLAGRGQSEPSRSMAGIEP